MSTQNGYYLYRSAVMPSSALVSQPNYLPDPYASVHQSVYNRSTSPIHSTRSPHNIKSEHFRDTYDFRPSPKQIPSMRRTTGYQGVVDRDGPDLYKSQYSFKRSSPTTYDFTSSVGSTYDRDLSRKKSPVKDARPVEQKGYRNQTVQFYSETVQKFKQQEQTTSKMSEELQKLKELRKQRLQAKEKGISKFEEKDKERSTVRFDEKDITMSKYDSQRFRDDFKKKESFNYTSPREEKGGNLDKIIGSLTSSSSPLNLDKYKSNYGTQMKKKTTKYEEYPIEAKFSSSTSASSSLSPAIGKANVSLYNGEVKDFVLGRMLGQGKFGIVYQAYHKPTKSLYAIKKVPKEKIQSYLMVDQFCLEVKLQMFLNHENILTLFNFFDDRANIYLVLQYMEEGTLFAHLKKNKKLPESEVAVKIKEIASAIKYLHENQIAHRDIKPENIVMSHGVCKLCDFGWATVCDERRKTYCGTFDYAPPEILAGAEYDYTVDLWCLGILTYELLVGKAPFYHISRKQTMKKILNVENTTIQYPSGISKEAISFIDSLIKKNPKERLTSEQILHHPFIKYAKQRVDSKQA